MKEEMTPPATPDHRLPARDDDPGALFGYPWGEPRPADRFKRAPLTRLAYRLLHQQATAAA